MPSGSCWCKTTSTPPASLYEAFESAATAKRPTSRLELHYTPKNGSWLNMAEIELAVLAGQCLDRRPVGSGRATRSDRSRHGRRHTTLLAVASTGALQPKMPASNSSTCTPRFRPDELLGRSPGGARRCPELAILCGSLRPSRLPEGSAESAICALNNPERRSCVLTTD
jgi:hypothetical protein